MLKMAVPLIPQVAVLHCSADPRRFIRSRACGGGRRGVGSDEGVGQGSERGARKRSRSLGRAIPAPLLNAGLRRRASPWRYHATCMICFRVLSVCSGHVKQLRTPVSGKGREEGRSRTPPPSVPSPRARVGVPTPHPVAVCVRVSCHVPCSFETFVVGTVSGSS
jgi:hypothetical protein